MVLEIRLEVNRAAKSIKAAEIAFVVIERTAPATWHRPTFFIGFEQTISGLPLLVGFENCRDTRETEDLFGPGFLMPLDRDAENTTQKFIKHGLISHEAICV